jgi:hypothetical protein
MAARPRQKTLAALLALGASNADAAKAVGVSVAYVNTLLKGELFQYEIDEQRRALIGERLGEYTRLASEQLEPNLRSLIAIRDDPANAPAVRLRAIELINEAIVPKAKARAGAQEAARVTVCLSPDQTRAIELARSEDAPGPARSAEERWPKKPGLT